VKDDVTLTPELLLRAYAMGIFPMAETRDAAEVFWVDPRRRGILPLEGFHLSRSLARTIRQTDPRVTLNDSFELVLRACADRPDTWINDEIFHLYCDLHEMGYAHSLEVWQKDGALWGGVYGVALGTAFFGESMISPGRNGSKIALAYLTTHLRRCGFSLFDTQFLTDHLASLGAIEVTRATYQKKLRAAQVYATDITNVPLPSAQDVIEQRKTQTS